MTHDDLVAIVRADLRAQLDPSNQPVQRDSPLWARLTVYEPDFGNCAECFRECGPEQYDKENDDFICDDCHDEIVRGQREDERLDSPIHQPYGRGR